MQQHQSLKSKINVTAAFQRPIHYDSIEHIILYLFLMFQMVQHSVFHEIQNRRHWTECTGGVKGVRPPNIVVPSGKLCNIFVKNLLCSVAMRLFF